MQVLPHKHALSNALSSTPVETIATLPVYWLVKCLTTYLIATSFLVQSLLLIHYLIRNGSERVVTSAREHVYDMKPLEEYTFRDEQGKDQGVNGVCSKGVEGGDIWLRGGYGHVGNVECFKYIRMWLDFSRVEIKRLMIGVTGS